MDSSLASKGSVFGREGVENSLKPSIDLKHTNATDQLNYILESILNSNRNIKFTTWHYGLMDGHADVIYRVPSPLLKRKK